MSQGSYNVPTGGSFSMVTFAGLMNQAWNAIASQNSGASAPTNGPGTAAQEFQTWFDTTNVNFPALKWFDGVNWNRSANLDVVNSNWLPKMGGGIAMLASAATVDVGAAPQTFIIISGSATVTNFGTAAQVGEEKKCQASGNLKLTYGAGTIVTPGLQDITTQPGDQWTLVYQGIGIWYVFGFTRALATPGFTLPTGACFWMPTKNNAISGAVRASGRTIGSASSGATELASATAINLFTYLYNGLPDTICPVSGGRGASAAADFAANKTIGTPDLRGAVLAGLDDMGNSAASRLTSLTLTPDGITAMATGGSQVVSITTAQLATHNHIVIDPGHLHTSVIAGATQTAGGGPGQAAASGNTGSSTTGISINNSGSGNAHTNIQYTAVGTIYICL